MEVVTRWMIVADLPQVVAIESQCFDDAMNTDQIREYLKIRNNIGMVAEDNRSGKVMGHIIYELLKDQIVVLRLAVHPNYQRKGIGRLMLETVERKLTPDKRRRICLMVSDSLLPVHLFLKAVGYKATSVQGNEYYFFKGVTWNKDKTELSALTSTLPSKRPKC